MGRRIRNGTAQRDDMIGRVYRDGAGAQGLFAHELRLDAAGDPAVGDHLTRLGGDTRGRSGDRHRGWPVDVGDPGEAE